jgi:hypothetical protein
MDALPSDQVLDGDQVRELPALRRLDLAAILAQLRSDPRQIDGGVDVGFFGARHPLAASWILCGLRRRLAVARLKDPVLGDLEPAPHRPLAQLDVVLLRAGEIHQSGAVALRRHHPQIHLQPGGELDAGPGVAGHQRPFHLGILDETPDQLAAGPLGGDGQQIQVAHRLAAAAVGSGHFQTLEKLESPQVVQQRSDPAVRLVQPKPTAVIVELADAGEDLLLALGSKALDRGHPAGLRRGLQLVDRGHPQLVPQLLGPFGSHVGEVDQIEQTDRDVLQKLRPGPQRAGLDDLRDVPGHLLADAGQRGQVLPLGHPPRERARLALHRPHRVAIGADAKGIGTADLQQVRHLPEQTGDLGIVGRGGGLGWGRRLGHRPPMLSDPRKTSHNKPRTKKYPDPSGPGREAKRSVDSRTRR